MSVDRLIAEFMKAALPIEQHLQQGAPLTALQLDSISLTVEGLESFLAIWKRKNGIEDRTGAVDAIEKITRSRIPLQGSTAAEGDSPSR